MQRSRHAVVWLHYGMTPPPRSEEGARMSATAIHRLVRCRRIRSRLKQTRAFRRYPVTFVSPQPGRRRRRLDSRPVR